MLGWVECSLEVMCLNHVVLVGLSQVIEFFTTKLEKEEDLSTDVNEVMAHVQQAALQWPTDRLKVSCLSLTLPSFYFPVLRVKIALIRGHECKLIPSLCVLQGTILLDIYLE